MKFPALTTLLLKLRKVAVKIEKTVAMGKNKRLESTPSSIVDQNSASMCEAANIAKVNARLVFTSSVEKSVGAPSSSSFIFRFCVYRSPKM